MSEELRKSSKRKRHLGRRERSKLKKIDPVDDADYKEKIENVFKDKFPTSVMCTSSEDEGEESVNLVDIEEAPKKPTRIEQKERVKGLNERLDRTLFIGNLPMDVKKPEIKRIIKQHGENKGFKFEIESVRFRGGVSKSASVSKGARKRATILRDMSERDNYSLISYVVLKSPENIDSFFELNGQSFRLKENSGERHLRFDIASKVREIKNKKNCLVVGNLPLDCTEDRLWQIFEKHGEIIQIRLIRDTATGAVKGLGFVEFIDVTGRNNALQTKEEIKYGTRTLRLSKYKPQTKNTDKIKKIKSAKIPKKSPGENKPKKKKKKRVLPSNVNMSMIVRKRAEKKLTKKKDKPASENK